MPEAAATRTVLSLYRHSGIEIMDANVGRAGLSPYPCAAQARAST